MLQDTNAYWTPLQRQLNCQLNPHQTAKPRESLEEPLDLATCSTCALQGFSRHNIVVGQPLLPIFHNWKNHHNILQHITTRVWILERYIKWSMMVYVWYIQQTDVAILSPNGSYMELHGATPSIQTHPNHLAVCQNLVPLVNIKIAGKWMFIP
jgi:hypothetical protein